MPLPSDQVNAGQVVGEHCKDDDIEINVTREKKLTNMCAAGANRTVVLKPPHEMPLELALDYIADDELVEVTPMQTRIRKRALSPNARKRMLRETTASN